MNELIVKLTKSFQPSKRSRITAFDEFLVYIYQVYGGKMNMCRSEKIKDKYIKERNSILQYAIKNKKEVLKHINK